MNKIKKILIAIIFLFLGTFIINVDAASLKENKAEIEKSESDVYLIGGTKFHNNYVISAGESAAAGANYVYIQLSVYNKYYDKLDRKPKVVYYSALDEVWYIKENGGLNTIDTKEEEKILDESLLSFFENNKEKVIEFDPGVKVDQTKYSKGLYEQVGVEYDTETKKFKVPATVTYFQFLSDNNHIYVDTNYDSDEKEVEYGELYIPKYVTVYDYNDKDAVLTMYDEDPYNDIYVNQSRDQFSLNVDGKIIVYDESEIYCAYNNKAVVKYVDQNGNDIDILSMTFEGEENIVYQILEDGFVSAGGINYTLENIDKAFAISDEYSPVSLLNDETLSERINLNLNNQEVYFSTSGYTLSCEKECFRITGINSKFTVLEGSILKTTTPAAQVITIGKNLETTDQNLNLVIERWATLYAKGHGIVLFGNGTVLDFYGDIYVDTENLDTTGIYGITGNGIPENGGTEINIYGGNIYTIGENTVALYLPQDGVVNIDENEDYMSPSSLVGETAIGIKSGTLNIKNASLSSTINQKSPSLYNNGIYSTGDVIYVELNDKYSDNVKINIGENVYFNVMGDEITKPGKAILVYNPNNLQYPEIKFELNKEEPSYNKYVKLIDGDKTYYTSEWDESIDILVGEVAYKAENLKEAILASNKDMPAKLMENININDRINLELKDQDVYLDLNTYELSCGTECIRTTGNNSSLTVSNGNIRTLNPGAQALTIGKNHEESDQKITLNVKNDLFINAVGHGIAVFGNGATLNSEASIEVNTAHKDYVDETGIYGITGNGTSDNAGTTINITSGSIRTHGKNTAALYLPQEGITNVSNASLEGESAIGIKSGTLNISNSTLIATADKRDPSNYNNGIYPTGDIIFVELNSIYADNVKISIDNSNLMSYANTPGQSILVYDEELDDDVVITAPDYSTKVIKNNGKEVYYIHSSNATMHVGNVGYTFENIKEAIDASNSETPLVLEDYYLISADETLSVGTGKYIKTSGDYELTVNGKLELTSDALINAKISMQGGEIISGGVSISAPNDSAYLTDNATYYIDEDRNIDVLSGNVHLGMDFNTMPNQKLTIKNGASFEIPEGRTLNVYSNLTIEDGAIFTVNGTMNIQDGGVVTGNYSTGENGQVINS